MKKYFSVILVPLVFLTLFPFILSLINLFDIEINRFIYLGSIILLSIITGMLLGFVTEKKAYLKGLALGSIMSIIMFLISLILKSKFSFYSLIYYLIVIVSSTMGSIIGITKKDK